ncbi:MAG TPA: polysaccharide biosynthesis/export family protein [Xanthobacteraceae bacterium]|jgi:polysaccharide export outer membrane protein
MPKTVLGWVPRLARAAAISAAALHSGCSTIPTAGPQSNDVRAGQRNPDSLPYVFVRVTPQVDAILERNSTRIGKVFTDRRGPSEIRFGVGDVVSVTLFESTAGGLFIPAEAGVRPGNFITLPNQAVDTNGNITIPYGGAIRAKGRTVVEVQNAIINALKDRAIDPQAVVALVDQKASSISVLGEVATPTRFPANASGERLLDAITRAGGPKNPGYDTWVMLNRDGRQARAPFAALVNEEANNIYVRPQDTIYVFSEPQTFLAFGASGQQGQFPFGAWRLSLAEAMAKAGGLNDIQADPASVFLYRGETREVAQQLGIDCSPFTGPIVPVIYNLNLRDPAGYFLATKFEMRNKDVIFASNAYAVDSTKFMLYLRMIIGTVNDPIVAATNAYTLKGLATGTLNATAIVGNPGP